MSILFNLNTTASSLGGGAAAAAGTGEDWKATVGGTWATGEKATLLLTDSQTGIQTQVGAGNITGLVPSFCFTYNNKVYMLTGATAYFSELGDANLWNDPNGSGNGFVTMSNYYSTQEPLTAIAPYQGNLIFTSRRYTQIWHVDPDPANYAQTQVLANIGTIAPLTLQPVGDMDVYMLADNGVRSVRVRDASNNAIIADVGTPIDAILQPLLASLTDAQKAASCGIVEPSSNRYWVYIPTSTGAPGSIYVFSYFPSSSIAAWSTYSPTYENNLGAPNAGVWATVIGRRYYWTKNGDTRLTCGTTVLNQSGPFVATAVSATVNAPIGPHVGSELDEYTPFVPVKFGVFEGQVWVRDSNGNIYQYGGTNNNTYDACGVSSITPYLNAGSPATRKYFRAVEAAFEGTWTVGLSTDYTQNNYPVVYANNDSSFQRGRSPVNRYGTHYSFDLEEVGTGYALFSGAAIHFEEGDEK